MGYVIGMIGKCLNGEPAEILSPVRKLRGQQASQLRLQAAAYQHYHRLMHLTWEVQISGYRALLVHLFLFINLLHE